jgi:type I restriction enzyme M protein
MAVKMLNPDDGEKIIDPSCGSAGFLIHTIRHVQHQNEWSLDQVYRYANEYLYAVDFDDRLKKVAKTMMIIAGDGKANVFGVNALDARQWQNSSAAARIGEFSKDVRDGDFDVVLTNPPFAGKVTGKAQLAAFDLYELALTGGLKEDEDEGDDEQDEEENGKAKKKGKKSVGGMKRDILFLERCLDLLKPGGRMAIVLPQGNLNNLGTRGLRDYLERRARLLAIVGLPYNTFKPFTNTKTGVVFVQKWGGVAGSPKNDYDVFMAVCQQSGKDNSGRYIYKTDAQGNFVDDSGKPITESGRPPAVKHDLDEIATAFVSWGKKQKFPFLRGA